MHTHLCTRVHAHTHAVFPFISKLYSESVMEELQENARNSSYKLNNLIPTIIEVLVPHLCEI